MSDGDLRQAILDAIIDCPSSCFVLMLTEVRAEIERAVEIIEVLRELRAMCDERLIRSSNDSGDENFAGDLDDVRIEATAEQYEDWFQENRDDLNLSWDPFVLWFEITDEGRLEWHRNLPSDYVEPLLWRTVYEGTGDLVIYAQDEERVGEAIRSWAMTNRDHQIDWGSRVTEPLPENVLNINRVIHDGMRVTVPLLHGD